jgi:hypothetical protein
MMAGSGFEPTTSHGVPHAAPAAGLYAHKQLKTHATPLLKLCKLPLPVCCELLQIPQLPHCTLNALLPAIAKLCLQLQRPPQHRTGQKSPQQTAQAQQGMPLNTGGEITL